MKIKMTEGKGEFLVGLALALRGTSLLFSKIALRTMGPMLLMGTRFLIAFVILALMFSKYMKATKKELLHCAMIGFFLFLSVTFELEGLKTTTASVTSFLEGGVVIMVPLLTCIIFRKLPDKLTVITCLIALVGVGFLTLKGDKFGLSYGEINVLLGTFFYSASVLVTDHASKNDNPMTVAIYQLFFIAVFAFIGAAFLEEIRLPASSAEWGAILALAIVCSVLGFSLQPIGQKYISAERAGLLTVTNPVTAAILGIIFLGETLTVNIVIGMILILISIVGPSAIQEMKAKKSR